MKMKFNSRTSRLNSRLKYLKAKNKFETVKTNIKRKNYFKMNVFNDFNLIKR